MKPLVYIAVLVSVIIGQAQPMQAQTAACTKPLGLVTTNVKDTSAVLKWNAVAGATGYQIRYSPVATTSWTVVTISNPNLVSRLITAFAPLTAYKWQVRTRCGATWSSYSGLGTFTTRGRFYRDLDADGFGNVAQMVLAAAQPTGYVAVAGDCNDQKAAINPAAVEFCDLADNDCDGLADAADPSNVGAQNWYPDADEDLFGSNVAPIVACFQPTGYINRNGDCNDAAANVHPRRMDLLDDTDNDCDGVTDEDDNAADFKSRHLDQDGDGAGEAACSKRTIYPIEGYVLDGSDCDDTDETVPALAENCNNGIDDDCDGATDMLSPCPQAPTPVLASLTATAADLTWAEACVENYNLEWSSNSGASWTTISTNEVAAVLQPLSPATLYKARLRYECAPGVEGAASSDLVFTTPTFLAGMPSGQVFAAFPNPADKTLNLTAQLPDGAANIVIADFLQRPVFQVNTLVEGGQINQIIDITALPSGLYAVRIDAAGVRLTTMFVKN